MYPGLLYVDPIFNCDDEVFGQQRRKQFNLAVLVGVSPLLFQGADLGFLRIILGDNRRSSTRKHAGAKQ